MKQYHKGRGALINPTGRFEAHTLEVDEYVQNRPKEEIMGDEENPSPRTQFISETAKSILSKNDSPDISFNYGINPYRGCEHGCIYCYARPNHEYLGLSAGLDFETKIYYKENAPELLRKELLSRSWKPQSINISGVTDCYQPVEKRFELTRRCLQVLIEFRNPFTIITKNRLVTRDVDVLKEAAERNLVQVMISVTSLDPDLISILEPRTSRPSARLEAIRTLADAGVPVGVMVAPVIPGLTDHEMPAILKAASEAGAKHAGYTIARLPYGVKDLFTSWVETHYPDRKDKIIHRIGEIRGFTRDQAQEGKLYKAEFGERMKGVGLFAEQMKTIFDLYTRKYGFNEKRLKLETSNFRRIENSAQGELF
jgi:DNA repair photolyase